MIFDGEKKVYILSEQEYDEMFDGKAHANLELIKARNQIADLSKKVHILNEANMKLENELGQLADTSKTIERLKEQLKIALGLS